MNFDIQDIAMQPAVTESLAGTKQTDALRVFVQRFMVLIAAPIIITIGLILFVIIRSTSEGPALLRLTRVNAAGQSYKELRFRCVWMDAPARHFQSQMSENDTGRDPRLTPIGEFMIRSGLNRLPRLYNVLMGDIELQALNRAY